MIDLYLKFADKAEAEKVLLPMFGVDTDDGQRVLGQGSHEWALDVIGDVHKPTGKKIKVKMDESSKELVDQDEMVKSSGYHVNIRLVNGDAPKKLDKYRVHPAQLKRVWA